MPAALSFATSSSGSPQSFAFKSKAASLFNKEAMLPGTTSKTGIWQSKNGYIVSCVI